MPIAHNITLEESTHRYTSKLGKEYTSVSKILARYKEPFDSQFIAAKVAQETGQTVEAVLADWATSAPYGTAVHKQLENYFLGVGDDFHLIQPYLYLLSQWKARPVKFYPEVIVCSDELNLAGTADMLVEAEDGWSILDWKTNKAIYRTSFGNKKLKAPLNHLDDCNYIHYALQMSMYAAMSGENIKKINLVHMPKGMTSLEVIPCPILSREVDLIFAELADELNIMPF